MSLVYGEILVFIKIMKTKQNIKSHNNELEYVEIISIICKLMMNIIEHKYLSRKLRFKKLNVILDFVKEKVHRFENL